MELLVLSDNIRHECEVN